MSTDRLEQAGLNRAWIAASAALPIGWHLEGLTCTSMGLAPEQRSDRWGAWATGPKGERIEGEGSGPASALNALGAGAGAAAGVAERVAVSLVCRSVPRSRKHEDRGMCEMYTAIMHSVLASERTSACAAQ